DGRLLHSRFMNCGGMAVTVADLEDAQKLEKVTALCGVLVKAVVRSKEGIYMARIERVDVNLEEAEARRSRSRLPMTENQLQPRIQLNVQQNLLKLREKQKYYLDRTGKLTNVQFKENEPV